MNDQEIKKKQKKNCNPNYNVAIKRRSRREQI